MNQVLFGSARLSCLDLPWLDMVVCFCVGEVCLPAVQFHAPPGAMLQHAALNK
jgi:hypothetical protein